MNQPHHTARTALQDHPITTLEETFREMDLVLTMIRQVRDSVLEQGEPDGDAVAIPLGLYICHMEGLLATGQQLLDHPRDRGERGTS